MNKVHIQFRFLLLPIILLLISGSILTVSAQEQRWIRVGETQCYFFDYGAEPESSDGVNFFSWPTQYSDDQSTVRFRALWIGARNFYDPVEQKVKGVKVIGAGPRLPDNQFTMIFPQSIELVGRYFHPTVVVDEQIGTNNTLYDVLDDFDDTLPCDRMVVIKFNTSMGVSVTKKVLAFTDQDHDDYFIHDYVFKNSGIYSEDNVSIHEQTLEDFWVHFTHRYGLAGVSSGGWGSTWGTFNSQWGHSVLYSQYGKSPTDELKGWYAWYGPNEERPTNFEEDWGCPNHEETGVLGQAKYTGGVTLFASRSPQEFAINDLSQPRTTSYFAADQTIMDAAVSQYDENFMQLRYDVMSEGHLDQTHDEEVGEGNYPGELTDLNPERNGGGGTNQGQGFGPYTFAHGDSIRIVFAEGVSGIDWEKCREVGANWYEYYLGTGTPELFLPDGSEATTQNDWGYAAHNAYKRAWCETGEDSVLQMARNAKANFESGYTLPEPPPAPESFTVTSGGDRIRLSWADNATSADGFDGYVVYRSEGNVKDWKTRYKKVVEFDRSNTVHTWDDTSAARGFDYYYYIQSKNDGSNNNGKVQYSSLFLTITSVPAFLRRPSASFLCEVRVVPNPYDIRSRVFQFGEDFQYDRINFYGLPPICNVKVFTERGDMIWEKEHTDGSGDELWDSLTSSRQIIVSGIYILYVEVTEDTYATDDKYATYKIPADDGSILYEPGDLMYHSGEKIYSAGEHIFRKFVVIR
ncbi:fibronectin type III domain-containing protein [candidate division KSB1 bacterium]|nr:fibronectin type III domain-containing protein [candidate division KSB1 bacterium]